MTDAQFYTVGRFMLRPPGELHHGDCVGADSQMHDIARMNGWFIVVHPPDNPKLRAFREGDAIWRPLPYLARNSEIVHVADVMLATPAQHEEQRRSGTWSTIRYARKIGTPLVIIWPDGGATQWESETR